MDVPPRILLLDDGELDAAATVLESLHLPYTRHRGGEISTDHPAPLSLLIATAHRADAVKVQAPSGARAGRPLRIAAVGRETAALREQLRSLGFHLLIRQPTHSEVWRLLIQRALHQGEERRSETRVALASEVSLASHHARQRALLVDISNRGCRLSSERELRTADHVTLEIPSVAAGGEALALSGTLVRIVSQWQPGQARSYAGALLFDSDMPDASRRRLGALLNTWARGQQSIGEHSFTGTPLPPCASPQIPGLTLDDETDPAIRAAVAVEVTLLPKTEPAASGSIERRNSNRAAFPHTIVSESMQQCRAVMGRDLSPRGIRIEASPFLEVGRRVKLALCRPDQPEPIFVDAEVMRNDGPAGMALRFPNPTAQTREAIEKLVACLPAVESIGPGEAGPAGEVLSEVLPEG